MATAVERAFVAQPTAFAGGRVIVSPFQFTTSGEDNLRVMSANSLVGVTLQIRGRRFNEDGLIEPFAYDHVPNTDRTIKTTDHALGVGALINVTITAGGATPLIGQTFVMCKIIRGLSGATLVLGTLLQGYVSSQQELAWPGSPITSSIDAGGYYRTITGTVPAAGADISESVPTGAMWELLMLEAQLLPSAAPGNRRPVLKFSPSGVVFGASAAPDVATAGLGATFNWQATMPLAVPVAPGINVAAIPTPMRLLLGGRFITQTSGLLAGDQWSAPTYLVREWLDVN